MVLDLILFLFVAILGYLGWRRGLLGEIVEVAGVFIAVVVIFRIFPVIESVLGLSAIWSRILVAAIVFLGVFVGLKLAARGLRTLIQKAHLGVVLQLLGLVFGVLKAGLIIAVLSAVLLRAGTPGQSIVMNSVVARNNLVVFAWIANILPDEWEARVDAALLQN
jgi:membrane protein required for colicin V production